MKGVLDGHLTDLLDPDISLGVSLEEALENGQKFEIYISKVKEVSHYIRHQIHGIGGCM